MVAHPSATIGPMPTIYKVKAVRGHGWCRGIWLGAAHVTADELEAAQYETRDEADEVAAFINQNRRLIPVEVVEREAHDRVIHGSR